MGMKPLVITERITRRESDSFKKYLSEVDKIERLTTDEEFEVAMKAFEGDEKAKAELIEKNLRFVISVAKQYTGNGIRLEDLVNEGNIGLVKAANRFDPTKGFKFISYAVWWIRRCIIERLSKDSRIIRVSSNKAAIIKPMNDLVGELEQKLERPPSPDEIIQVASSDFTPKEIKFFLSLEQNNVMSLDRPFTDESDANDLKDTLESDTHPRADYLVNQSDLELHAKQLLDLLPKQMQKEVIIMLFGLNGKPPMELKEIAEYLDVSRERVRQVRDQALRILKAKAVHRNLGYMFRR
jgi:RNA polymerase primary sigma factor